MTAIHNHTGVPHLWFEQSDPNGQPLDVLVIRATFDFAENGEVMTLADTQQAIVLGDCFDGPIDTDPLRAVVTDDGDLLPYKPGTDILVCGHAQAPDGQPQPAWLAGIRVGRTRKMLRLHGPREFRKSLFGWRLSEAQPVTQVALDYRLAYGGSIVIPAELTKDQHPELLSHTGNPAGTGWLPNDDAYRHLSKLARQYVRAWIKKQNVLIAPQIESAPEPLRHPTQQLPSQGLSAQARWWMPRLAWQGHCDQAWLANRHPLLPLDFDSRYYQCAHPDLIATPHLDGNESITLLGLLQQRTEMYLPGWRIAAAIEYANGEHSISFPVLDTLRFHLDQKQASLVWRMHFDRDNPAQHISLAATATLLREVA